MTARRRVTCSRNCGASPFSTATAATTALCLLAASVVLAQDPAPQPQPPLGPVEGIQLLLKDVDLLLQDGTLKPSAHKHLVRSLEDARLSLYAADPTAANDAMDEFATRTGQFLKQGLLDEKQSAHLVDLGAYVDQEILKLSQPLPLQLRCAGKLEVVYVDDDAGAGGDGSSGHPFQTLSEALDYAAAVDLPGIEIQVGLGRYEEEGPLEINCHTRIVGTDAELFLPVLAGSIHNFGPYCLEISGLEITDAAEGPAGAIYVSHEEAFTSLSRVFILDATGFGLIQHGGLLAMESCVIDRTVPLAEPVGVAMHLSGGIQAQLQDVSLTRNRGGGLIVTGAGTSVFAELLTIDGTEINPYSTDHRPFSRDLQFDLLDLRLPEGINPIFDVPDGRAALDVREGAAFFGRLLEVVDNEYSGVFVANSASAELEYAYIAGTRGVERFGPEGAAGHNIWSRGGGALQMRYFLVERADLCGVMIGPDAQVDLFHGVVAHNPVGICLQVDGFDVSRLMNDVLYSDNATTLEATTFPVSEPADPVSL